MTAMQREHLVDTAGPDPSGWASFIGIVICLCGNVIISFALNIQRLAHERIQTRLAKKKRRARAHRAGQEIESGGNGEDYTGRPQSKDGDEEEGDEGTQYLKSHLWWTGLVLMCIGEVGNFVACMLPRFN
jgi:hypothetical protein